MKIEVNDAIMGSGKTYKAIERMKITKDKFLYVTPFLTEVDRVITQVPNTHQPKVTGFTNPDGEKELVYKRGNLLGMANKGLNIVTTHSLFSQLHRNDYSYFKDYDLILDEVVMPIKLIDMVAADIKIAFNEGLLTLNESTDEVSFTAESYDGKFYAQLKKYCDTSNVIYVNDRLLVWAFPPEIFKSFKSVTVLTYLFEGSLLASYFKYYNIPYKVNKASSTEESLIKGKIKGLLKIYQESANKIGDRNNAFSVNWLRNKNPKFFKETRTLIANLLGRKFKAKSINTGFTTFKEFRERLKGKGYSNGFMVVNERATNMFAHKNTMIYLANRYVNPNFKDFFRTENITVNEDLWALSEMLQWIFRGSIREDKPMNLYIPSKRMRTFLINWLDGVS